MLSIESEILKLEDRLNKLKNRKSIYWRTKRKYCKCKSEKSKK